MKKVFSIPLLIIGYTMIVLGVRWMIVDEVNGVTVLPLII